MDTYLNTVAAQHRRVDSSSAAASRNPQGDFTSSSVQFRETRSSYTLTVPLQGYNREDVKVEMDNNRVLMVRARKVIEDGGIRHYRWRLMQPSGNSSLKKPFKVPQDVNVPAVSVSFNQGNLQVVMPKFKTSVRYSPYDGSASQSRRRGISSDSPAGVATVTKQPSGPATTGDSEMQEPEQHHKAEAETKDSSTERRAQDPVEKIIGSETERSVEPAIPPDSEMQEPEQHHKAEPETKDSSTERRAQDPEEKIIGTETERSVEPAIPPDSEMQEQSQEHQKVEAETKDSLTERRAQDNMGKTVESETERSVEAAIPPDSEMQEQTQHQENVEQDVKDSSPVQNMEPAKEAESAAHEAGGSVKPLIGSEEFKRPDKAEMMETDKEERRVIHEDGVQDATTSIESKQTGQPDHQKQSMENEKATTPMHDNHADKAVTMESGTEKERIVDHEDGVQDLKSSIEAEQTRQPDHEEQTMETEKATTPMHIDDSAQNAKDSQGKEGDRVDDGQSIKSKIEADNTQKAEEAETVQDDKSTPTPMDTDDDAGSESSNTTEELMDAVKGTEIEDQSKTHPENSCKDGDLVNMPSRVGPRFHDSYFGLDGLMEDIAAESKRMMTSSTVKVVLAGLVLSTVVFTAARKLIRG